MTGYIYYYDIASLVFCSFLLIYFFYRRNVRNMQTGMYGILLSAVWISTALSVLVVVGYEKLFSIGIWLPYWIEAFYSIFLDLSIAAFYCYMMLLTKGKQNLHRWDVARIITPYAIAFILLITNYWTHFVFEIDPVTGVLTFKTGKYVLFTLSAIYMAMGASQAYRNRGILTKGQKWAVVILCALGSNAIFLQCTILPQVLLMQIAATLSTMSLYFTLENPGEYRDKLLNTWNRSGFTSITSSEMDMNRAFSVLAMRLDGVKYINESLGVTFGDKVLKEFSDFLSEVSPVNTVFHISGMRFAVLSRKNKFALEPIVDKLKAKFDQPLVIDGISVNLKLTMCIMKYPEQVSGRQDLMDIIKYVMKEQDVDGGSVLIELTDEILERRHRENAVLKVIKDAILNDGFEMHYQPIYSVEKGRFASAEALIRLKETSLGYIGPDEFIPLAEQNGMILDIGNFVFKDVCRFMAENKLWEKGIDYVEVNLSVMQCMQDTLHAKLLQIMDEYQIPYDRINLEITETAAVVSNDILKKNMDKLGDKGITFALDDFGTGYSNISHIFNYSFDMIKLDKSMVWSSMESDKAKTILKHTIKMLKEMDMHIVAEGVETQDQADVLKAMGCDYFQGYLYSRPVDEESFKQLLEINTEN